MAKKKEEILHCSLRKDKGRWREISPALELHLSLRREEEGQAAAAAEPRKVSMRRPKQSNPKAILVGKSADYLLSRAPWAFSIPFCLQQPSSSDSIAQNGGDSRKEGSQPQNEKGVEHLGGGWERHTSMLAGTRYL